MMFGGFMEEQTEIRVRQIAEFWLKFDFLEKFKELGEKYSKQIKQEVSASMEKFNESRTR